MKCFSFIDRTARIQFFEKNPVVVTMTVSDATDQKIRDYATRIQSVSAFEDRKDALGDLIGHDNVEAILAQSSIQDNYALLQIQQYVLDEYNAVKEKNLSPAGAGRKA